MNDSASESDAQDKQESEVMNINNSEKFIELPLIIKFIRIST